MPAGHQEGILQGQLVILFLGSKGGIELALVTREMLSHESSEKEMSSRREETRTQANAISQKPGMEKIRKDGGGGNVWSELPNYSWKKINVFLCENVSSTPVCSENIKFLMENSSLLFKFAVLFDHLLRTVCESNLSCTQTLWFLTYVLIIDAFYLFVAPYNYH